MSGLWRNNDETPEGKCLVKRRDGSIPDWQSACKNESRNWSSFQSEICRLRAALQQIVSAGSRDVFAANECVRIAREALGTDER